MREKQVIFLDRDGVINELVVDRRSSRHESPYYEEDVALTPGAVVGLRRLERSGFRVAVVSNQPAAAKGTASARDLLTVHKRVVQLLARERIELLGYWYCFHHPDGVVPDLSRSCLCRKPRPGLLLKAAAELGVSIGASWMIGDSDSDVEAGQRAGCRTVLLENSLSAHRRVGTVPADFVVSDLAAAAAILVQAAPPCNIRLC